MNYTIDHSRNPAEIDRVETTADVITGRGGLALFVKYLTSLNIYPLLLSLFGHYRKSKKGNCIADIFKQLFCFFVDGTSHHLVYFDHLKRDEGYAAVLENRPEQMLSSHEVKRFLGVFSKMCSGPFRAVLRVLFLWRLRITKPEVIELCVDSMVMDNDTASKREGVSPTYKKVKGFHPLNLIWEGKIIDTLFRGGKKHGNSGQAVVNMLNRAVNLIRTRYNQTVPIIVRMDSGFFDQEIFAELDTLGVGFICSGKLYKEVKERALAADADDWELYENGKNTWEYLEFGYRCQVWSIFYRAFYTRLLNEGDQFLFDFAGIDNMIVTNLGINPYIFHRGDEDLRYDYEGARLIIGNHHQRGADELPHRGLKNFGTEKLPFKRFAHNTAFYYCMVIAFFLFESFKEDVLAEVIPIGSYATTVRRMVLDIAAKIVKTGRYVILKISRAAMENLHFDTLWEKCQWVRPLPE